MKKAALFVLSVMIAGALAVPTARAQRSLDPNLNDPAKEKAADNELNHNLDAGRTCLDYRVDVPTLVDNDHRIYWKQADCIIVHIMNNPFRYNYKASIDETPIAEDDVIGGLGPLVGLKSMSSTNGTTQNPATAPKPKTTPEAASAGGGTVKTLTHNVAPKPTPKAPKACTADEEKTWVDGTKSKLSDFQARYDLISPSIELLKTSAQRSDASLQQKDTDYQNSLMDYLKAYRGLVGMPSATEDEQKVLLDAAFKLQDDSLKLSIQLTGDRPFEAGLVTAFASAKASSQQLDQLSKDIDQWNPAAPACTPSANAKKEMDDAVQSVNSLQRQIWKAKFEVQSAAVDLANQTCHYKERKAGEYSWVHDKVYSSVTKIVANRDLFEADRKREGPFTDPTSAVLTITRDVVSDETTTVITDSDSSALDCAADPSTVLNPEKPVKALADIPAPAATPKGTKDASNSGDKNKPQTNPTTDKPKDPTTLVLTQPWIFGRPRLVLTGGITPGFLAQKDYQRVTTGSGSTASAIVGLKTDSRYRLTPMLYGHVLLPWYARHQSDAWYGTLGVTAKNDSKGTDPEFLVGVSRSFAQQRFFATVGAYLGEKQKLDGGLQLGQSIPSGITGELPVTKGYHVGWGFGISYRFASTKDPQKDTSTQNTSSQKKTSK